MIENRKYLKVPADEVVLSLDTSCFSRRTLDYITENTSITKESLKHYGGLKEVTLGKFELADLVIKDIVSPKLAYKLGVFMAGVLGGETVSATCNEIVLQDNCRVVVKRGRSESSEFIGEDIKSIFTILLGIVVLKLKDI